MELVGRRARAYRYGMALFRFLFAPVLLAVAVLAGSGEERREPPADPPVTREEVAPRAPLAAGRAPAAAASLAAPREVPAGDPVRPLRAAR